MLLSVFITKPQLAFVSGQNSIVILILLFVMLGIPVFLIVNGVKMITKARKERTDILNLQTDLLREILAEVKKEN